jgi:hypothetical protein
MQIPNNARAYDPSHRVQECANSIMRNASGVPITGWKMKVNDDVGSAVRLLYNYSHEFLHTYIHTRIRIYVPVCYGNQYGTGRNVKLSQRSRIQVYTPLRANKLSSGCLPKTAKLFTNFVPSLGVSTTHFCSSDFTSTLPLTVSGPAPA